MKCFIYRNLHKPGHTYSIRALEGVHKGRVVGYGKVIVVDDATFSVSKAGHARVIATGHKNVHAGIVGEVVSVHGLESRLPNDIRTDYVPVSKDAVDIMYNPWLADRFMMRHTREPIVSAATVYLHGSLIEAIGVSLLAEI